MFSKFRSSLTLSLALIATAVVPSSAFALSGRLAINNGATYTRSRSVTAYSYVAGATRMSFSTGGAYSRWTAFRRRMSLTLPVGDGTKRVRGRYMSATRRVIYRSDTIVLDTRPPAGTFILNDDSSYSIVPTITTEASVTGANLMRFKVDAGSWGGWIAFSRTKRSYVLSSEGTHTVAAQFRDPAGNVLSQSPQVRIVLARTHLSGSIGEDTTLSAGAYVLDGNVTVEKGARLTILPAVCLLTPHELSGLTIDGRLDARGTRRDPTMLTTETAGPRGEGVAFSAESSGALTGVTFNGQRSALAVGSASVDVSGCGFFANQQGGRVAADADVKFTRNNFAGNTDYGLSFDSLHAAQGVDGEGRYSGNGGYNTILVKGGTVTSDTTLPAALVPYRLLAGIAVQDATLTISAGTTITADCGFLDVGDSLLPGRLVIAGTSTRPCLLTSTSDRSGGGSPGDWGGVALLSGSSASISHTTVRSAWAGVEVANDGAWPARITDCTLANNCYGIYAHLEPTTATAPILARNTITDNSEYGLFCEQLASYKNTSNTQTYLRNGHGNCIAFDRATPLDDNVTLFDAIGPAKIANVILSPATVTNGTLTLDSGVLLKLYWTLTTEATGCISSLGTTSAPVLITSAYDDSIGGHNADTVKTPAPGEWPGLSFRPSSTGTIRHTTIRYADKALSIANDGGVPVEVSDSSLYDNFYGIYSWLKPSPGTPPILQRNTITDNREYGFYFEELVSYGNATNTETYERNGHANCIAFAAADPMNGDVTLFDPIGPTKIAYVLLNAKQRVTDDATLTIDAGTVLKLDQNLRVGDEYGSSGNLLVNGTTESPVLITPLCDNSVGGQNTDDPGPPEYGDWFGISAYGHSTVSLQHAPLRYTPIAVGAADDSVVRLNFMSIRDAGTALVGGDQSSFEVTNTEIQNADTGAAFADSASARLESTKIHHVTMGIEGDGSPSVETTGVHIHDVDTGISAAGALGTSSIDMTATRIESAKTCVSLGGGFGLGGASLDCTGSSFAQSEVGVDMLSPPVAVRFDATTFESLSEVGFRALDYCGSRGTPWAPKMGHSEFKDNTLDIQGPPRFSCLDPGVPSPPCHPSSAEAVVGIQAADAAVTTTFGMVHLGP